MLEIIDRAEGVGGVALSADPGDPEQLALLEFVPVKPEEAANE